MAIIAYAEIDVDEIERLTEEQISEGTVNDNPDWVTHVRLPNGEEGWVAGPDGVSYCHVSDWLASFGKPAATREQAIALTCGE